MKQKKRTPLTPPLLAAMGAALVLALLLLSLLISSGLYKQAHTGLQLPDPSAPPALIEDGGNLGRVQSVTLTTRNVQAVIASLERVPAYSLRVTNTLYFDGESAAVSANQYYTADACRTDLIENGSVRQSWLRAGQDFYAWNAGETAFWQGAAGDFSADSMAMLPDWQSVTVLPQESILAAEAVTENGEPTIRVEAGEDGRRTVYTLSTVSGLLRSASYYENDRLIRTVTVSDVTLTAPDTARFILPNGTSVIKQTNEEN